MSQIKERNKISINKFLKIFWNVRSKGAGFVNENTNFHVLGYYTWILKNKQKISQRNKQSPTLSTSIFRLLSIENTRKLKENIKIDP